LVTDDPARGDAARRALLAAGCQVRAAPDGLAAEAALADHPPDILVVEMLLPGRSGFALAGRAKDLSGGRTGVVMLAADPPAAHRDYAYAAGVDLIVPPAALPEAVARLAGRPAARIGPPAPAGLAPAR
jgi:two-component system response regulator PrrA